MQEWPGPESFDIEGPWRKGNAVAGKNLGEEEGLCPPVLTSIVLLPCHEVLFDVISCN